MFEISNQQPMQQQYQQPMQQPDQQSMQQQYQQPMQQQDQQSMQQQYQQPMQQPDQQPIQIQMQQPEKRSGGNGVVIAIVAVIVIVIVLPVLFVVGSGVLYVWAGSLAEGNTEKSLELYVFSGVDGAGDVTDGNGDDLVRISMDQGEDLNWASISVKISVDGGAPMTCANNAENADGYACHLVEYGYTNDYYWSVGDGVIVVESGEEDLCSSGDTCSVEVTITDIREGKVIDKTTAMAE
jgi:hypothetical protein